MGNEVTFWPVLPDGRTNSVSTTSITEAPRRTRNLLGATKLFVFDVTIRRSRQIF